MHPRNPSAYTTGQVYRHVVLTKCLLLILQVNLKAKSSQASIEMVENISTNISMIIWCNVLLSCADFTWHEAVHVRPSIEHDRLKIQQGCSNRSRGFHCRGARAVAHRGVARSKNVGWTHGERGARAYNGALGRSPQRVQGQNGVPGTGAEPLVRESGGKAPLKLKTF